MKELLGRRARKKGSTRTEKNNEARRLWEQQAKFRGTGRRSEGWGVGGWGGRRLCEEGGEKFCSECVVMERKEEGLSESELI